MSSLRAMVGAFMGSLVERAGGVDAAAAIISARLGHEVSKGSISKRLHGQLGWPFEEIIALEDALGDHSASLWRARGLPEIAEGRSLLEDLADVARETGEALGAVAAVAGGTGSRAVAAKEVNDALIATKRLAAQLEVLP